MERIELENLHGFLILQADELGAFSDDPAGNTRVMIPYLNDLLERFVANERAAVEKAKELFGRDGVEFYLIPLDVTFETLEILPYRFQKQIVAVRNDA